MKTNERLDLVLNCAFYIQEVAAKAPSVAKGCRMACYIKIGAMENHKGKQRMAVIPVRITCVWFLVAWR